MGLKIISSLTDEELITSKHPLPQEVLLSGRIREIIYRDLKSGKKTGELSPIAWDELWLVISGYAEFSINDETSILKYGSYILVPKMGYFQIANNTAETIQLACFKLINYDSPYQNVTVYRYDDEDVPRPHPGGDDVPYAADIDDNALVDYVAQRAATEPKFASILRAAHAKAAQPSASAKPLLSPDKAPRLWADRDPGTNPADFIRANYGEVHGEPPHQEWLNNGVTRPDLKNNPGLYNAYASWIGEHPEDKLVFAPGGGKPSGRPRTADPGRTLERNRESALAAAARRKEQRNSGPNTPSQ